MKLIQKRFLLGSTEFEITDTGVRVRRRHRMNDGTTEVPFTSFSRNVSYQRSGQIRWLVFAGFFVVSSLVLLFSARLPQSEDEKYLGVIAAAVFLYFAACCGLVFYRKKLDVVILHNRTTGGPLLIMHRLIPSEVHVKEFVAIIHERIPDPRETKA